MIEDGRERGLQEGLDRAMIVDYDELNGEGDTFPPEVQLPPILTEFWGDHSFRPFQVPELARPNNQTILCPGNTSRHSQYGNPTL